MRTQLALAAALAVSTAAPACSKTDRKAKLDAETMTARGQAMTSEARGVVWAEAEPERVEQATAIMARFAERTGLSSDRPPRRYLWTDAFAVCTYLSLAEASGDADHLDRALALVDQVHATLGRHREDDPRAGWLSGLAEDEGAARPTAGGLRIGKPLPERPASEPLDRQLEWERDGQYLHYLTKWMHALDVLARARGDLRLHRWSRELAVLAHDRFSYRPRPGASPRLYWKMSVDLSRPQVPSMGQHDALDGLVSAAQIHATGQALGPSTMAERALAPVMADYAAMIAGQQLATDDPLGLGGLLLDAARVAQLMATEESVDPALLERLLAGARQGLAAYTRGDPLAIPASHRLAFRELGLAIGLEAVAPWVRAARAQPERFADIPGVAEQLRALEPALELAPKIAEFWLAPEHQRAPTWTEHRDINEVMLAASLVPRACVHLPTPTPGP